MIKTPAGAVWLAAVCAVAPLALGCGGDSRQTGQVSGKVTSKGQPLADIGVNFEPIGSGAGRGSFGRTDASGSYTLRFIDNDSAGALVGKHQVTFSDLQAAGSGDQPDAGPAVPRKKSRLPAAALENPREYEVKEGDNQADFAF
jgi:hypothetical protein